MVTAASASATHEVADLSLAAGGQARIDWADGQMAVLRQVRERFARERPLAGLGVGACLHVTPETANLIRTLRVGGADVALCAANPLSTQDDVAAALVDRHGVGVFATRGEDERTYYRHLDAVCEARPQLTMDDGADLIGVLHAQRAHQLEEIVGATEATTTGVIRARGLEAAGALRFPVVATDDAGTKSLPGNRHGTGQSTLEGIVRATGVLLAGSRLVVLGYGACGRGIAIRARGAGAQVVVCEVDPLRALEAVMDGYAVMPALAAAAVGDVFVTATGSRAAIARDHLEAMRDGAIVCNAGHFDVEVSKHALEELATAVSEPRPDVREYLIAGGRRINLLSDGRVVNLAAAEGNPASVMDLSFSAQALSAEHIARHGRSLEPRVHSVPAGIDSEIATLKLESIGVEIDRLTDDQLAYRGAWDRGT